MECRYRSGGGRIEAVPGRIPTHRRSRRANCIEARDARADKRSAFRKEADTVLEKIVSNRSGAR